MEDTNCAKCRTKTNYYLLVLTQVSRGGEMTRLCPNCHREWADIENAGARETEEKVLGWLRGK